MSAQFLQSYTPQENQTIRVNDAIIRGALSCAENAVITGNVSAGGNVSLTAGISVGSAITHANIPSSNVEQLTSITTAIDASSVANPYNFAVTSQTATTAANGEEYIFLDMPTGILTNRGFAGVSVYYYSGVVGTAGYPLLEILTVDIPNNRIMLLLENKHPSNALNGAIHFRVKYELGTYA
tara:strand:+ start:866 stop:1411 length:546 start_codon:yes stop_codon:yes gene_type:complete